MTNLQIFTAIFDLALFGLFILLLIKAFSTKLRNKK
jgi:hypothetical protein